MLSDPTFETEIAMTTRNHSSRTPTCQPYMIRWSPPDVSGGEGVLKWICLNRPVMARGHMGDLPCGQTDRQTDGRMKTLPSRNFVGKAYRLEYLIGIFYYYRKYVVCTLVLRQKCSWLGCRLFQPLNLVKYNIEALNIPLFIMYHWFRLFLKFEKKLNTVEQIFYHFYRNGLTMWYTNQTTKCQN